MITRNKFFGAFDAQMMAHLQERMKEYGISMRGKLNVHAVEKRGSKLDVETKNHDG